MSKRDEIVAVGLMTAPEFRRWGGKLRQVYEIKDNSSFEDLIEAIDKADLARSAGSRESRMPLSAHQPRPGTQRG